MSKVDLSFSDNEARALEREAKAAKADMEQLVLELAARLASLDRRLEGQVAELERTRIEASKAEAEAAHQADRYALERASDDATQGLDVFAESLARQSRA